MATKLDLADAQFIGFYHGKWSSSDIIGLVEGMGLTGKEWKQWKEEYSTGHLNDGEIREIDEYFRKNPLL